MQVGGGRDRRGSCIETLCIGSHDAVAPSKARGICLPGQVGEAGCKSNHTRRGLAAESRVQRGQVSRARHELTGAPLAPKNESTGIAGKETPGQNARAPESPLELDPKIFAKCLRTAPSGNAPGPGRCTNEMLRVCLDDLETLALLTSAAEDFARAETPQATQSFMFLTMTALQKRNGGVRGDCHWHLFQTVSGQNVGQAVDSRWS